MLYEIQTHYTSLQLPGVFHQLFITFLDFVPEPARTRRIDGLDNEASRRVTVPASDFAERLLA
jgi:hypothetical protein